MPPRNLTLRPPPAGACIGGTLRVAHRLPQDAPCRSLQIRWPTAPTERRACSPGRS